MKELFHSKCVGTAVYTADTSTFVNIFPTTFVAKYIVFSSNQDVYYKFNVSTSSNTEVILANTQNQVYDIDSAGFWVKGKSATATINVVYYV